MAEDESNFTPETGEEEVAVAGGKSKELLWALLWASSKEKADNIIGQLKEIVEQSIPSYSLPEGIPSAKETALNELADLAKLNQAGRNYTGASVGYAKEVGTGETSCTLLEDRDTLMLTGYLIRECGYFEIGQVNIEETRRNSQRVLKAWLLENQGCGFDIAYQKYLRADSYYSDRQRQWASDQKRLWAWNSEKKAFLPERFTLPAISADELIEARREGEDKPVLAVYGKHNSYFNPVVGKIEGQWEGEREPVFSNLEAGEIARNGNWQFLEVREDVIAIEEDGEFKKKIWEELARKHQLDTMEEWERKRKTIEVKEEYARVLEKTAIPKKVLIFTEAFLERASLPELDSWLKWHYPVRIMSLEGENQFELNREGEVLSRPTETKSYETQDQQAQVFLTELAQRAESLEELSHFILNWENVFWSRYGGGDYELVFTDKPSFSFSGEDYTISDGSGSDEDGEVYFIVKFQRLSDGQTFEFVRED